MTAPIPRVSVGMPVYNGERYIKETIESILGQTFTDFELVISDNASTDRTEEICRKYCSLDRRVRYYRNRENIGGSGNYTRVFELSLAPYFKWAAHDDLCAPTFLGKCVDVLDRNPAVAICYPGSAFIDQHGAVIAGHDAACNLRSPRPSKRVHQFLADADTHCFPIYGVIRRNVLKKTSLVAPYISSDQTLLLQLALMGEFYEVQEPLFFFREHPQRSIWQFKTFAGYAGWHDPSKQSRIQMPCWRLAFEFLRSVARAEIQWREAKDSYVSVAKWCWWHRSSLVRDLVMTVRQVKALMFGLPPIHDKKSVLAVKGTAGFDDDTLSDPSSSERRDSDGREKV